MNWLIAFVQFMITFSMIESSHLDKRISIENINFNSLKATTQTPSTFSTNKSITKNEFESKIVFEQLTIHKSEFKLRKFYSNLTFHYGKDTTKWVLAKRIESNFIDLFKSDQVDFVEFKYEIEINDMFINPFQPEILAFTNVMTNYLILSYDNGVSMHAYKTEFVPEYVYFTKDSSILFVHDASNEKLWITQNSGHDWQLISDSVTKVLINDANLVYYIKKTLTQNQLFKFSSENSTRISNESVIDIKKWDNFVVVTQISQDDDSLEVIVSEKGNDFQKWNIISDKSLNRIQEIKILLMSKSEIYISLTFDDFITDLYVAKTNEKNFKLALVNFEAILSLDDKNTVYAANARVQDSIVTFLKTSNTDWKKTLLENDSSPLHLNLNKDFVYKHEDDESIFSFENYPSLMLTSDSEKSGVYLSQEDNKWSKILDETYLYSVSHRTEFLIVAIKQNELTNKIIYSLDNGNSWNEYEFSKNFVYSNSLINEPNTNRFILFCTRANQKSRSIISFEFKPNDLDYETIQENATNDEEFDLNGLFKIDSIANKEHDSFELDLVLNVNDLILNNYLIKIVSNEDLDSDIDVIDMSDYEMSQLTISNEKTFKTIDNHIEINGLTPGTQYTCYIYANLTSVNTNETRLVLLDKKLVIKTKYLIEDIFISSNLIYIMLSLLILAIFCPIIVFLLVERKRLFKVDSNDDFFLPKYVPLDSDINDQAKQPNDFNVYILDDNQILIENNECE